MGVWKEEWGGEGQDHWTDGRMERMEERVGKAGRNTAVKETGIEGKVETHRE